MRGPELLGWLIETAKSYQDCDGIIVCFVKRIGAAGGVTHAHSVAFQGEVSTLELRGLLQIGLSQLDQLDREVAAPEPLIHDPRVN